jgi:hypothetical protein
MRRWEADIKQYEAGSNISLQTAKLNADVAIQSNAARLEAAKIGLTTSAQRVASAWSMVSASAGIWLELELQRLAGSVTHPARVRRAGAVTHTAAHACPQSQT